MQRKFWRSIGNVAGWASPVADISNGPVATLPYSRHALPDGAKCDQHPKRKAVARIQGETDSFGCEYNDVCDECLKQIQDYRNSAEARTGMCDWCKREATDLRDRRDFEEGMGGPVYRVCGACVQREMDELEAEDDDREWDWDD